MQKTEKDHPQGPIPVTVICITFNQEKYIRKTLDGILMQRAKFPYEIIVHDDASTDGTAKIIKEYVEKYPGLIIPVFEKENQYLKGVNIVKDLLTPMARGKYLAICEGDDYWTDSEKLQLQFEALEQHPECSICVHCTQGISEDETKNIQKFPEQKSDTGIIPAGDIMHRMLANDEWVFHTTSYFFRKADVLDMNEKGYAFWIKPAYGDFSYMQMAALKGDFYYIDKVMSAYRIGSIGSAVQRDNLNLDQRKKRAIRFLNSISDFDKVTNYKFHNDAAIAIKRYTFIIAESENNYDVIFSPEMRDLWCKRPFRVKIRIIASRYFPFTDKIYYSLRDFFNHLKSR